MTTDIRAENASLYDNIRWNALETAIWNRAIKSAFVFFREHKLEPILIKGWAIAGFYPPGKRRPFVDIDLAFSAVDFGSAKAVYESNETGINAIDLHRELRNLDTLRWTDLFDNSQLIVLDGVSVRILRPEDHLRVLSTHWLNDGGASKDRLWDIYYAVSNRPTDFDWDRCLNVVSQTRRRWVVSSIGLAHKYLDLFIDDLPFADEARSLPLWLTRAVEREWASEVHLIDINFLHRDPIQLLKQIKKRIPPNPIEATIEMDGDFDAVTRVHYQIGSFFKRILPSLKRLSKTLYRSGK